MDKGLKQKLIIVAFGVSLFAALMNIDSVCIFIAHIANLLLPIGIGMLTAFILNVPVSGCEKLIKYIFAKAKRRPKDKTVHFVSLSLVLFCVVIILAVLCTLVIPQTVQTVKSIAVLIEENWPKWISMLNEHGINTTLITDTLGTFDLQQFIEKAVSNASVVLGSIADIATSTVFGVANCVMGIIIAVYILIDRDTLLRQAKKLLSANLKPQKTQKILFIAESIQKNYSRFFRGQCFEALILATLIFTAFSVFGLPYAGLVAAVTAFGALIPYIGAFVSCLLAVILALLISPAKALLCFIVYQIVQFIETQFIYPRVVGGSVGLSPLWTLVAVLIGGKLFGLIGMILFIPLTAVIYELIKENTNRKIALKSTGSSPKDGSK